MSTPAKSTTLPDLPRELPQSWLSFYQDINRLAEELRQKRALPMQPEEAPDQDKKKAA